MKNQIVIIGGGITGSAIAWTLSHYHNIQVVLLEREAEISFGVSKANSGIVHAAMQMPAGTLKAKLCQQGNQLYRKWHQDLAIPFEQKGELIVIGREDEFSALEQLQQQGRNNGVEESLILNKADLRKLEPHIHEQMVGALYAPCAGVTNPYEVIYRLGWQMAQQGVQVRTQSEVLAIDAQRQLIQTSKEKIHYDFLINAAGLDADRIAAMVGDHHYTITPLRGEEYLLDRKCQGLVKQILFPLPNAQTKGCLIIPTLDGTIMVGPSAEPALGKRENQTSDQIFERIFTQAKNLIPHIDPRWLIASFAGLRPVSTSGDFMIEFSPQWPQILHVAGIQSPGLTAAPAIGAYVGELLQQHIPLHRRAPQCPTRAEHYPVHMRTLTPQDRHDLIQARPEYGQMVCRCEMVSKGEIIDSIDHGATTLDGIKFRTRAQMGRCQGSFCTGPIIEVMAEKLAISPLEVTKRGGASQLIVEKIGGHCQQEPEEVADDQL